MIGALVVWTLALVPALAAAEQPLVEANAPTTTEPPPAGANVAAASTDANAGSPRPWLLLPFVGYQQFMSGDNAAYFDGGLRLGLLAGWRITPAISLNVEGLLDRLHPHPPLLPTNPWTRELALSPLFHFILDDVELVIGPKLGVWFNSEHAISSMGSLDTPERGWALGFNGGAFVRTGVGAAFGVVVNYQVRWVGNPGLRDSEGVLGLSLAVLL